VVQALPLTPPWAITTLRLRANTRTETSIPLSATAAKLLQISFADYDGADSLVIQADGKIVVAGTAVHGSTPNYDFALARYNTDGSLDVAFGPNQKWQK